jgi:undecaprenyl-diphosphatase
MIVLHDLDTSLFLWLNGHHAAWLDRSMWYISTRWVWIPLYLWMLYVLFRRFPERTFLLLIVVIAVCIGFNDIVASSLFKPMVARLRPSQDPALASLTHLVNSPDGTLYRGGLYGFYSSHAANFSAAITLFIILAKPQRWIALLLVASVLLVGYSRVYLGVHYPTDILMGFFMGVLTAWAASYWFLRFAQRQNRAT